LTFLSFRSVCLGDYTNTFVDHIIDIFEVKDDVMEVTEVTDDNSASKTEPTAASSDDIPTPPPTATTEIDFEALKTLSEEGIDMSFLDALQERVGVGAATSATNHVKTPPAQNSVFRCLVWRS